MITAGIIVVKYKQIWDTCTLTHDYSWNNRSELETNMGYIGS